MWLLLFQLWVLSQKKSNKIKYLKKTVNHLNRSSYVNSIYCISDVDLKSEISNVKWINRKDIKKADSLSLNELLMQSLIHY